MGLGAVPGLGPGFVCAELCSALWRKQTLVLGANLSSLDPALNNQTKPAGMAACDQKDA